MHATDDTDKIEISTHAETSETKTFLLTRTGINIEESESQPIEDKNESDSEQEWPLLHEGMQSLNYILIIIILHRKDIKYFPYHFPVKRDCKVLCSRNTKR